MTVWFEFSVIVDNARNRIDAIDKATNEVIENPGKYIGIETVTEINGIDK